MQDHRKVPGHQVILYLLGAPGVGKTSIVRHLLPNHTIIESPKWTTSGKICAAGHYTGKVFDGADRIPYTQGLPALEYWYHNLRGTMDLTLLDGARLATKPCLEYLRASGVPIRGVLLTASPEILAERRLARGSDQDPKWMLAAATRASNFAAKINAVRIHATSSIESTVADIMEIVK